MILPNLRRLRFLLACPLSNNVSGYNDHVNRQPDQRCSMRNDPRAVVREVGGQETKFYVDPDRTIWILLTQVDMGEKVGRMVAEFQELPPLS